MERSEPSLVPEWLRNSVSTSGAGGSLHSPRYGCSKVGDKNSNHSSFLDRTSSGNSRHILSKNGSSKHPYSSFNQNSRGRNREKEKDKPVNKDVWELDNFDPLGDILFSRTEKDKLRRSHSLLSRKPSDSFPQKAVDVKTYGYNNNGAQRVAFDKEFPSLGNEEKGGGVDLRRVSSLGMSTAMQSLNGGEGWTSALAEVPKLTGSSNLTPISVQCHVPVNASPTVSSPLASPNMAEALSQPSRAHTSSQLPDKTQILEELAIKQSKQLIPVTPSMPKAVVHNSDKLKPKTSLRPGEHVVAAKSVQQQQPRSSQVNNRSVRGGQVRSEVTSAKSSNGGKFLVLKPVRDNAVQVAKDVAGVVNNASNGETNSLAGVSIAASNVKSPKRSKAKDASNVERKVSSLSLSTVPLGGKRPSLSQIQSRSDFFKLMRKKSLTSASDSSALVERSAEMSEGAGSGTKIGGKVSSNGDSREEEKNLRLNVYPDEEETAFLRSLGWDENAGEDDGLTEEEINAFYEEYIKMKPSLKLCKDVEQKIASLCESLTTGSSRASSELSFSEPEIEA